MVTLPLLSSAWTTPSYLPPPRPKTQGLGNSLLKLPDVQFIGLIGCLIKNYSQKVVKQIGQVLPFVPCISEKSYVIQQIFEHKAAMSISDILIELKKTLPKAQRTRGLSSSFQSKELGHITSSNTNFIFKISTKHLLQNLNQASPSQLNLKFKILTKLSFSISIKIQLRNLCKTPATKC